MSFNGSVFVAGAYAAVWDSLALGIMVGEQSTPIIEEQQFDQPITNSDQFGRTTLGGIRQGGDAFYQATFMEWKSGPIAALYAALAGRAPASGALAIGNIGKVIVGIDIYDLAAPLVLTPQSGTLAASAGPTLVTASKAVPAPNNSFRVLLGNVLREIPFRMQLMPYLVSTVTVHHADT
jgi:xanthosine utilization system XapX-like protein